MACSLRSSAFFNRRIKLAGSNLSSTFAKAANNLT
jgi:hypothetical protein